MFKKLFLLLIVILPCSILFAGLQSFSLVVEKAAISTSEIKLARDVIKKVESAFISNNKSIDITVSDTELEAISKMGSNLMANSRVLVSTSDHGVVLAASTKVIERFPFYLNASCFLSTKQTTAELYNCKLGHIPMRGRWVKWLSMNLVSHLFGNEVAANVNDVLDQLHHADKEIRLIGEKQVMKPQQLRASLQKIGQLAQIIQHQKLVNVSSIDAYLEELNKYSYSELAPYMKHLFILAKKRSKSLNPVDENTAILWALAIQFGDSSFSSMAGINYNKGYVRLPTLRGRGDLTQHFLYSAILGQLGHEFTVLAVGETKELLDSLKGGTGFSFSDLAADKAGLAFSNFITGNEAKAYKAQKVLANSNIEDAFFPFIHDLPDGLKDEDYDRIIGTVGSKSYRFVEDEINKRIDNLVLYNNKKLKAVNDIYWQAPLRNKISLSWYKVDTHVHSQFSTGRNSINTLAEKAVEFGCDAIAVTDYGHSFLRAGQQNHYLKLLEGAKKMNPDVTIMAGLEWNIPPFRGKEQATIILPYSKDETELLADFALRFDQGNHYSQDLLSPKFAFKWLEALAEKYNIKPLILYNHPNKKNAQQRENEHDIEYWRELSSNLVSFSGSPGRQKLKGRNGNGYRYREIQTENGWDPSISQVGGEWDRLLQKGYKVWGASASSEFTNEDKDYWPCEYSSTHIQSESASQNHILAAFQAGRYWGQQGNFVKNLSFSVSTNSGSVVMGQVAKVDFDELVNINLSVELNLFDWQSELSDLDEVELIVITDERIDAIKLDTVKMMGNTAVISMPFFINSENTVFRFRGSHINLADQTMMFYTNPIKLVSRVN
ncbi:PHP domain-containing protein [Alteromonas sp. 5E99-2]|uniref:PHP domain-containing protein n=1 Tax=Alteromonas sp. 5E99-2 TaxID=2817683 RepID=UPI001A98F227|nr:PHP domain-containing protein [Alteromonas sp. 5E99-2]MBO1257071.1 PHP domain-containing protein [Alteromonas sp. 5E99-2]